MMYDFIDWIMESFFRFMAALILAVVAGISLLIWASQPIIAYSCRKQAEVMQLEYQYGFWTDCMVRVPNGHWVPLDQYRAIDDVGRK